VSFLYISPTNFFFGCVFSAFGLLSELENEFVEPLQKVLFDKDIKEWTTDKITANIDYAKKKMKELAELEKSLE